MRILSRMARASWRLLLWGMAIAVFDFFLFLAAPYSGNQLLFRHLLFGFHHFLGENLPRMSWDAGTWAPGVVSFLVATLFIHLFLSKWASRTGRHWSVWSSVCVALIVPVLFVISFLIPGVILQWEMLRQAPWIDMG